MRHELANGWVEVRDARAVTERQRRPVKHAFAAASGHLDEFKAATAGTGISEDAMAVADRLNDALIVALVSGWSYDAALTVDGVIDCPDYDAVCALLAPMLGDLFPDFTPDAVADPKAATAV